MMKLSKSIIPPAEPLACRRIVSALIPIVGVIAFATAAPTMTVAQRRAPARVPRPDWSLESQKTKADIFFDDAFKTLDGVRPAHLMPDKPHDSVLTKTDTDQASKSSSEWARVISAGTLESEIKSLVQSLQSSVKSPARFAGGDFKMANLEFGWLATLFRIVDLHDEDVRWKNHAAAASSACAAAAQACKNGSRAVFDLAKATRVELSELLNAGTIESEESLLRWDQVANRQGWMQWMGAAETRIKAAVASDATFSKAKSRLMKDAEMIKMVARILTEEQLEDGADEDYRTLCETLGKAANDLLGAAKQTNHERATKAAARIDRSCIQCHEIYKG